MALYVNLITTDDLYTSFSRYLNNVKEIGYQGIYFDISLSELTARKGISRNKIKKLIRQTRNEGLKIGFILHGFQNKLLYKNEYFTAPVSHRGIAYVPGDEYYPVCLNNPIGKQLLKSALHYFITEYQPDNLYLEHIHFPFNWAVEELDVQDKLPQYCYCPFCIAEFSSMVGEIVTHSEQINELMPEWLEWRANVVLTLISEIRSTVAKQTELVIALPPLAIIDLSFSTGQLPYNLIETGLTVSPQLLHLKTHKNLIWIEDILDQYKIDLNSRKIMPMFEYRHQSEFDYVIQFENQFDSLLIQPVNGMI